LDSNRDTCPDRNSGYRESSHATWPRDGHTTIHGDTVLWIEPSSWYVHLMDGIAARQLHGGAERMWGRLDPTRRAAAALQTPFGFVE